MHTHAHTYTTLQPVQDTSILPAFTMGTFNDMCYECMCRVLLGWMGGSLTLKGSSPLKVMI